VRTRWVWEGASPNPAVRAASKNGQMGGSRVAGADSLAMRLAFRRELAINLC
jgi:hypothetical protein